MVEKICMFCLDNIQEDELYTCQHGCSAVLHIECYKEYIKSLLETHKPVKCMVCTNDIDDMGLVIEQPVLQPIGHIYVFAQAYNILGMMNGQGRLAYNN